MLLVALPALAHGTLYATSGLTAAPEDPAELWALAGGWGLVHTTDGGDSWEWWCEEALDTGTVTTVAALGPGEVAVGGSLGMFRVTPGQPAVAYTGLPADAQVGALVRYGDKLLADVVSIEDVDGLYVCEGTVCSPSGLVEDGRYVQSIRVDGGTAWVVTRYASTLHSMLSRSLDGETWALVHDWDDGSESRTLLDAGGDELWVWALPRDTDAAPWLERSGDGGETFSTVWTSSNPTQELPTVARVGFSLLLSDNLGHTLRTDDDGGTWLDRSDIMPMIRCTAYVDGETLICADHFADGFDFARLDGAEAWTAFGCMDQAAVADPACDEYEAAYLEAGLYGGGECDASYAPAGPEEPPCGCGGSAGLVFVGAAGWGARRRRRR